MSYLPALFFALIWIWSDSIGALLSVISTYFYFGWEGTPLLVPKIFGLALFAFSGPVFYRVFLYRFDPERVSRFLLLLLFALYTALSAQRASDFFAWGTLLACWLGGITLMTVLRQWRDVHDVRTWIYALQTAFFFYLSTRISQGGLPLLLLAPQGVGWFSWGMLSTLVLVGLFLPRRISQTADVDAEPAVDAVSPSPISRWRGSLGIVLGLLMGLSVGIIENLHIWSARTPMYPAAIYLLSLAMGAYLGQGLWRAKIQGGLKLALAGLGTALGIYALLYLDVSQWTSLQSVMLLSLSAHTFSAMGLVTLWCFFLQRMLAYQKEQSAFFPWANLQAGFVFLLLILAMFLLKANPAGFWVALFLSLGLLGLHEWRGPSVLSALSEAKSQIRGDGVSRLWTYTCGLFFLVGVVSLAAPAAPEIAEAPATASFGVMSSNIRYGWTDDYRFEPLAHMRYLRDHTPEIMGLQEVNKGHTSGAYTDLFRLYQQAIPGQWSYGDAHYGFGNALLSRFKVLNTENRVFQAKDMLKRACLMSTLEVNGQPVTVMVTHVSHLEAPNPVRQAQVEELSTWIKNLDTPWILIGDFNATPDTAEIQKLAALSHPIYQQNPAWLNTFSFPGIRPSRRIDYIFFSKDFELEGMEILDNQGSSDHRPVFAKLRLSSNEVP